MRLSNTFIILSVLAIVFMFSSCLKQPDELGTIYYVAQNGSDRNPGTENHPFSTISKAAQLAIAGDKVIVGEGIYREWVKPKHSGSSNEKRISYQAKKGADVRILGSERIKGWIQETGPVWKLSRYDDLFHKDNAFRTLSRHPEEVGVDESGDGWGWLKYGRWTHLGDIIIDGKGLTEKETREEVMQTNYTWCVIPHDSLTIVYANFGTQDPNRAETEMSLRPYAFYPEKIGINYISIQGFTIMNVASHWAPPTVHQPGALGSNGGHHWNIHDNIVAYSKSVGISIGIPRDSTVGASKKPMDSITIGHHIIKNNVILRCGQGAIAGQGWNSKSEISGNVIEDINYRKEFGGWETAGIKFHNGDSLLINNNFIRNVYTQNPEVGAAHGIWMDFNNSNWNVCNNLILGTEGNGFLTEANFHGPNLFANNIVAQTSVGIYSTRGDAFVNNLFVDTKIDWSNQSWGNRPQIGQSRWIQNVFIGGGFDSTIIEDQSVYSENVVINAAETTNSASIHGKFEEGEHEVILVLDVDTTFFEKDYTVVDHDKIDLPFSFDASVRNDYLNNSRSKNNLPGPFTNLTVGINKQVVYVLPDLYHRAKTLVN